MSNMIVKWNNCFLCFNALNSFESDRQLTRTRKNLKSIRVSLEYLLREPGKCSNLLKLFDNCEEEPVLSACNQCVKWTEKVVNLQLSLEAIQMKLISEVGQLRDAILKRSKIHGDHGKDQRSGIETFEEWVTEQEALGGKLESKKRILEALYDFHNGVYENKAIKVPFVLLETSLEMRKLPKCPQPADNYLAASNAKKAYTEVKVEVDADEPLEPGFSGVHDDGDRPSVYNWESSSSAMETKPLSETDVIVAVKAENSPTTKRSLRPRSNKIKESKLDVVPTRTFRKKVVRLSKSKVRRTKEDPIPMKRPKQTGTPSIRVWTCDTCQLKMKSIYKLEFHLIKHHETGEAVYKCDQCPNSSFSGQQLYNLHMDSHLGKHRQFCDVCTKRLNYGELRDHLTSCHGDIKQMPCSYCSFVTTVQDKFIKHVIEHGKDAKCFNCYCGQDVRTRRKLLQHLYEVHGALEPIQCTIEDCEKTFFSQTDLAVHLWWHRDKQKGSVYNCSACGKVFKTSTGLRSHKRNMHLGAKPYPCDQCDERCIDKAQLRRHQINVHGAEKFQCPSCDKSFNCEIRLRNHSRIHNGTMFSCDQCERNFVSAHSLRRHMTTHLKERSFACETCGKRFQTETTMKWHKKAIHSKEKNYLCEYCDKAFTVKQYLQDHLRTHTGERPFVCDICGASYSQAGQLWGHKKKHAAEK